MQPMLVHFEQVVLDKAVDCVVASLMVYMGRFSLTLLKKNSLRKNLRTY